MLRVVTGYRFSERHQSWFANGTKTYDGERVRRTLSMAFRCECGDALRDGDPIDEQLMEQGRYVHANCV